MKRKGFISLILAIVFMLCIPVSTFALGAPSESHNTEDTIITPFWLYQEEAQRQRTYNINETHPSYIFVEQYTGSNDSNGNPIILKGTLYESEVLLNYPATGQKTVLYQGTLSAWVV